MVLLGQGMDNLVYDVNGALVVRFSKEPDPARRAELISSRKTSPTATGPASAPTQTEPHRVALAVSHNRCNPALPSFTTIAGPTSSQSGGNPVRLSW